MPRGCIAVRSDADMGTSAACLSTASATASPQRHDMSMTNAGRTETNERMRRRIAFGCGGADEAWMKLR